MHCAIVIPTYNRAKKISRAIESSLAQTYDDLTVAVVDDGSTDNTMTVVEKYFDDPRFVYIKLKKNVGTTIAKNIGIALLPFDAISFHDSDDIFDPTKILLQQRALALDNVMADECLNWKIASQTVGSRLKVGAALTGHWLITAKGERVEVTRSLSIVDDFFPNLQMNAGPPGDWILVNSGLFRREIFTRNGGFANGIEEDRDFRNRLLMNGEIIWLINQPLLTKIDSSDNLTTSIDTGYASLRRIEDRKRVWKRVQDWLSGQKPEADKIDMTDVEIEFVSRPNDLCLAEDIPVQSVPLNIIKKFSLIKGAA
jgi:glycosyltransferase involved in cell wall biosynthesis